MKDSNKINENLGREKITKLLDDVFTKGCWSWGSEYIKTESENTTSTDGRHNVALLITVTPAGPILFEDWGSNGFEMFLPVRGNSIDDCETALIEGARVLGW